MEIGDLLERPKGIAAAYEPLKLIGGDTTSSMLNQECVGAPKRLVSMIMITTTITIPVVPHKVVAEVSKTGNL